ncbi:rho GTPase-activating protein 10-like [Sinocyclocheilus grahami]|uniref:rho GTPase-activating protein 10-like n=1 Tax=Sinocyclocheilus grahami TaxID=75366 RepID=UPI0007AC9F13|nr:PREDICTED: rho GTPase-activating protein 10-like [Sinocyclocheilus grahami]
MSDIELFPDDNEFDTTGPPASSVAVQHTSAPQDTIKLSLAQKKFAQCLGEFKFEYIGDAKTDDEKCIDESLQEFSSFLRNLEDQRDLMMRNITETLMKPLEKFRKEHLGSAKAERKRYEKETEKYYSSLEKLLSMSAKKKEPQLQEADMSVEATRQHFQESSLEYVCKLQEIQERKKFECVEPMLAFFQTVFTFYHQGYELAKDFDHYKKALQINIQNTRSRFEGTRSEVYELMKRIKESPQEYRQTSPISSEGYLYVQEKRPPPFGSSWVKRYCTFVKEQKILHMKTFDQRSGGKLGETESVTIKSRVRKTTDTLDRRFCLDIEITDRPSAVLTVQALSEDDYRFWMHAMGGKESMLYLNRTHSRERGIDAQLDDVGITFVKNSINAIETRGINDQGLYRVVGVSSKVQKLLSSMIDEKSSEIDLAASEDWDVKTITSALKLYLRSLPEPLMTYKLYKEFIVPAKSATPESRVQAIHCLVHKLPERNRLVLSLVTKHLAKLSTTKFLFHPLQPSQNALGVGTVADPSEMERKKRNVAILSELELERHRSKQTIFGHAPSSSPSLATTASTRQSKRLSRQNRPLAVYNPQVLDIQTVSPSSESPALVNDETSVGSNESVSSQFSNASGTPPKKSKNHHATISSSLPETTGICTAIASWMNSASPASVTPVKPGSVGTEKNKPEESVTFMKAKAVYPCEAEHDSELSFQVGAIFHDVTLSREPGWLEGVLEGKRGLIPKNYVDIL